MWRVENGRPFCRVGMVDRDVACAFTALAQRAVQMASFADSAVDSIYRMDSEITKKNLQSMLFGLAMDSSWVFEDNPTARHNRYRDVIFAFISSPRTLASEEVRKGYGMTDIFIPAKDGRRPVIIEVKTTIDKGTDLGTLAEEVLGQIEDRCYADEPDIADAIRVGIGIRMKTVEVAFRG